MRLHYSSGATAKSNVLLNIYGDTLKSGAQPIYLIQIYSGTVSDLAIMAVSNAGGTAFCAAAITGSGTPCPSAMTELYNSRPPLKSGATIGPAHGFPTPTIFEGQVYMGTDSEVNVFGICSTAPSGKCL